MTILDFLKLHPTSTVEITKIQKSGGKRLSISVDHHSFILELTGNSISDEMLFSNRISTIHNELIGSS